MRFAYSSLQMLSCEFTYEIAQIPSAVVESWIDLDAKSQIVKSISMLSFAGRRWVVLTNGSLPTSVLCSNLRKQRLNRRNCDCVYNGIFEIH